MYKAVLNMLYLFQVELGCENKGKEYIVMRKTPFVLV